MKSVSTVRITGVGAERSDATQWRHAMNGGNGNGVALPHPIASFPHLAAQLR